MICLVPCFSLLVRGFRLGWGLGLGLLLASLSLLWPDMKGLITLMIIPIGRKMMVSDILQF